MIWKTNILINIKFFVHGFSITLDGNESLTARHYLTSSQSSKQLLLLQFNVYKSEQPLIEVTQYPLHQYTQLGG